MDVAKFFLLKNSRGEKCCLREFQPGEQETVIPGRQLSPIAVPLCPARGHPVKVETLQLLESDCFDALEQGNAITSSQKS